MVNEDGTYKAYEDISGTETEFENGTWSIEENMFILTVINKYDSTAGELQPIEDGDIETQTYTFGVDEDDLSLFAITPVVNTNLDTLVGEWMGKSSYSYKGSSTTDLIKFDFELNEDGSFKITVEQSGSSTVTTTGTWSYDPETLKMNIETSDGDSFVYDVEIVGNTFIMVSDLESIGYVLDKVE